MNYRRRDRPDYAFDEQFWLKTLPTLSIHDASTPVEQSVEALKYGWESAVSAELGKTFEDAESKLAARWKLMSTRDWREVRAVVRHAFSQARQEVEKTIQAELKGRKNRGAP